jgi:hypothetical protein
MSQRGDVTSAPLDSGTVQGKDSPLTSSGSAPAQRAAGCAEVCELVPLTTKSEAGSSFARPRVKVEQPREEARAATDGQALEQRVPHGWTQDVRVRRRRDERCRLATGAPVRKRGAVKTASGQRFAVRGH